LLTFTVYIDYLDINYYYFSLELLSIRVSLILFGLFLRIVCEYLKEYEFMNDFDRWSRNHLYDIYIYIHVIGLVSGPNFSSVKTRIYMCACIFITSLHCALIFY